MIFIIKNSTAGRQFVIKDGDIVSFVHNEIVQETNVPLIELFNKHFNDLNIKIDELKSRLGINPASEPTPKENKKIQQKKQKKSQIEDTDEEVSSNEKSEADKKIEKIQTEIDKTLEKLIQIEIEV